MPVRIADVVNWADIRDAVVVSLLAGVGLCSAFGFALVGWARSREHYERRDAGLTALYALIGLIGLAITLGGIALGLIFIASGD